MCFKQFHKMCYQKKKQNANHRNHPESIPSPLLHHRFLAFELVSLKLNLSNPPEGSESDLCQIKARDHLGAPATSRW